jgi:hypothetical protein
VRNSLRSLLLAGLLGASLLCAQSKRGGRDGDDPMGDQPRAQTQSRLDIIDNILKLNHAQQKQVKSILDAGQKEAAPIRDQMAEDELELGEGVASGRDQNDLEKAADYFGELQARMAAIEMQAFAKIYRSLEKDQQPNAGPVFYMMQGIFKGRNWMELKP